jgi:hypothetical protein
LNSPAIAAEASAGCAAASSAQRAAAATMLLHQNFTRKNVP